MDALSVDKLDKRAVEYQKIYGRWVQVSYLLMDIFCILLGAYLVYYVRFSPDALEGLLRLKVFSLPYNPFLPYYKAFLVLHIVVVVLIFKNQNLYTTPRWRSGVDEAILVFKGVSAATLLLMIFMYLANIQISRFVVLSSWGGSVCSLTLWRYFKRRVVESRTAKGHGMRNILIVGAGKVGHKLADILKRNQHLGMRVTGFIDDYKDGENILGRVKDLPQVLQRHFIEEVFITIPSERELVKKVIAEARRNKAVIKVIPELFDGMVSRSPPSLELFGDLPAMEIHREPIPELGLLFKRLIDVAGGLVGVLLSAPVMLAIAIAIKIESQNGPVIYRSRRMGKKGQIFDCYKFRTMVPDADAVKDKLRHLNERSGPFFKITNDPRITKVGRFLRKYNMDEIPQFFNVIKGDMTLVGPRPHPIDDFKLYNLKHYRRLDVRPGMTSLWAIKAQNDPSFESNMTLDLYYIENWSLWLDIRIILSTIPTVLKGVGR